MLKSIDSNDILYVYSNDKSLYVKITMQSITSLIYRNDFEELR